MASILDRRASGVLLHPTSLPGPYGIGDLGAEAHAFIDTLAGARQRWWQMLPVVPPADGASPYGAVSAFAGNPLLIDLRGLVSLGLLTAVELQAAELPAGDEVDFGLVHQRKLPLLDAAHARFVREGSTELRAEYTTYQAAQRTWLEDHALFLALHAEQGHRPWHAWPTPLRDRDAGALAAARHRLASDLDRHAFIQFVFDRQWAALRRHAHARGVLLMGDLPIFVAHDSAEVWAHRSAFLLDAEGQPSVVAGVPPDYFAEDGQLWGNPMYDWAALAQRKYDWWVARFANLFGRFDAVRVDHFIGFHRAWHVPADATTAKAGRYVPGPRAAFFERIVEALGDVPIVAEDLGTVTPAVWALRDRFGFPGMRVLQFGFGDIERGSEHLPHEYTPRSVAYTGTHDNDTIVGWYTKLEAAAAKGDGGAQRQLEHVWRYLGNRPQQPHWAMIHLVMQSAANLAIVPAQDLLGLGTEARMNVPGVAKGNWGWRMHAGALNPEVLRIYTEMTAVFGRAGVVREAPAGDVD
jgi:4-alpha-glucanotransferase